MQQESQSVIDDVVERIWPAPISTTHIDFCERIAEGCLGIRDIDLLSYTDPRKFTVGEFCPRFGNGDKTLQGKSVYMFLVPGPFKSSEDLIERACITARAAKENGAHKVVLLATDMPHARQDRGVDEDEKAHGEANTVRWHARQFRAAGIDEVITLHEHSPRIAAFFAIEYGLIPKEVPHQAPTDSSYTKAPDYVDPNSPTIQERGRTVFKSINPAAIVADYTLHHSSLVGSEYVMEGGALIALKAMDKGNRTFIDSLWESLFLPNAARLYCNKARRVKNNPDEVEVDVIEASENFRTLNGAIEVCGDDGLDTGGTMIKAARWSSRGNRCAKTGREYGVPADRVVYFTHAWLGGSGHLGVQHLLTRELPAREFVTTDTRPFITDQQHHRFRERSTVLQLPSLWADAIIANELGHDVTRRYNEFASEEEQHSFISHLYGIKRHERHFLVQDGHERRGVTFFLRE